MTHSGGRPHTNVGDRGQPYEVTFDDGDGNRKVLGWAETTDGTAQMMRAIDAHPTWHSPRWRDRRTGETGPAQSRVSDVYLQSSLKEIGRSKELDSHMISTAFLRMLLVEITERRAESATLTGKIWDAVTTEPFEEWTRGQGGYDLTRNDTKFGRTYLHDKTEHAWRGWACGRSNLVQRATDQRTASTPALRAYDEAMQAAGVPREPLAVYTSNSWVRVGLARKYREVMTPDTRPDIRSASLLEALVAAFNAMLVMRRAPPPREVTAKQVDALLRALSIESALPTELHRALHAKLAEMAVAVRRAEEEGYARGLEDAKKHPETLGLTHAKKSLDLPPEVDSRYPNDVMNETDPDECAACLAHPTGECNEHVSDIAL